MKTCNFLHDRWNSRLDWARDAVNEFKEGLAPEVKSLLPGQSKTTCNVAVYGKSQVGKTTLILRLMGIDSEEVDEALRAGRPEGKSCTSTAVFYRRAPDDCWHASCGTKPVDFGTDTSQLVLWLQDVREQVENGGVLCDPIELFIPARYFSHTDSSVEILDLPGVDSSTPKEKEHVRYVSEQYLPIMELVLLVTKTDSLIELFPKEGFGIPFLDNWRAIPNRFRFVTTYALQPQSMRDRFTDKISLTAVNLRSAISELAEKHLGDAKLGSMLPDLLFPVDVGKSWHDLKEKHSLLHEKAHPVMGEILTDLRSTIRETSDEWSKLAAPFAWHRQIESYKATVQEKQNEVLGIKNNAIEMLELERGNLESSLNEVSRRSAILQENRSELVTQGDSVFEFVELGSNDFSSCNNVSSLQESLGKAERSVCDGVKAMLEKHNEWCRSASWRRLGVVEKTVTEVQAAITGGARGVSMFYIRKRLAGYWMDKYLINGHLDTDRTDCGQAIVDLKKDATEVTSEWITAGIAKISVELEKDASSLAVSRNVFDEQIKKLNRKINSEESGKQVLSEKFTARLEDIQKSLDSASKYTTFLNDKWRREMTGRWNSIKEEANPTLRLLYGCEFLQLHFDMRKLEGKVI